MISSFKAYAKVNLALDVVGVRDNGYHDVRMIMQNLDLYDELDFEINDIDEICPKVTLVTNKPGIPTDDRNLIVKAAKLLFNEFKVEGIELKVKLVKNIPVEAGMAGGSTDAAATFHAVNELLGLKLTVKELMERGVLIGADVPYCILARTALSEGIGEVLTELPALPECIVLVAKPAVGVSTKMVYTELDSKPIEHHPDVDGMIEALNKGDLDGICDRMENVLEYVTVPMHPVIEDIKKTMISCGARNAIMSGSGPTVFGIFANEEDAAKAKKEIEDNSYAKDVYITKPV